MPLPRLDGRARLRAASALAAASVIALPIPALAEPRKTHKVTPGDTLSELSVRYGVPAADLARLNGLSDPHRILAGRTLDIPGTAASTASSSAGSHVVSRGETLTHIARRYGVSVASVAAANGIENPSHIVAGDRLSVPGGKAATGTPSVNTTGESVTHTVGSGETLSGIARRYKVPAAAIATANGIVDRNRVVAGAKLRIPVTGVPAPQTASRAQVERLLEDAAERFGWDPNLIKALSWQESGWNNSAVSSAGAVGIMQVLPGTNREVSSPRAGRTLDLEDPAENIEAGMHYLELLYELTGGQADDILAGYYQGVRSVNRNGRYPSTERYIANITALWDRFEAQG